MRYLNAFVITLKEMTKSLAIAMGYREQEPKNSILNSIENGAITATEAVEELESSLGLLSIDKFEVLGKSSALSGASTEIELIQSALDKEMENLQKSMEGITYQAKAMSDEFLKWLDYVPQVNEKTGEVTRVLKEGYTTLESIGNLVIAIGVATIGPKLVALIKSLELFNAELALTQKIAIGLNKLALVGLVYSIMTLVTQWDELSGVQKTFYTLMLVISAIVYNFNNKHLVSLISKLSLLGSTLTKTQAKMVSFSIAGVMVGASLSWLAMMDNFDAETKKWVGAIMTLVGAFTALAVSIMAVQGLMTWGTAVPILLSSIGMGAVGIMSTIKGAKEINGYATGGFPERGEIFVAREKGPELVGSMGNRTTVANNYQIIEGIKYGVKEAIQESSFNGNSKQQLVVGIDDSVNGNALARALLPFIKVEDKRTGGSRL